MENQKNVNLSAEADQFLLVKTAEFNAALYKWDQFFKEVSQKVYDLAVSGVSTSSGWDSSNSRNYNVDINIDMSATEKYLESIKDEIPQRAQAVYSVLDSMDIKLDYFSRMGLSGSSFDNLVQYFLNCADRCQNLECTIRGNTKKMDLPGKYLDMKRKWSAAAKSPIVVEDARLLRQQNFRKRSNQKKKQGEKPVRVVKINTVKHSVQSQPEPEADPDVEIEAIRQKRDEEFGKIRKKLMDEYKQASACAKEQFDADLERLQAAEDQTEEELLDKKTYLKTIGFFQFAEKKEIQNRITSLEHSCMQLQQEILHLADDFEQKTADRKQALGEQLQKQRMRVDQKYPAPRGNLRAAILLGMEPGKKYTVYEITAFPGITEELTANWLRNNALAKLVSQGKLQQLWGHGDALYTRL